MALCIQPPVDPVLADHIETCVFRFFFQGKQPHWSCNCYVTSGPESFICIDGNDPISLENFDFMSLLPAFKYPSVMVIVTTMPPPKPNASEPILTDADYEEPVITAADFEDDGILECWTVPA